MDQENIGGARPSLAAHSKDASTQGQTPASRAHANEHPKESEGLGNAKEAVGGAAETMREQIASTVDQAAGYVRQQPMVALAAIGFLAFALGTLVGGRARW